MVVFTKKGGLLLLASLLSVFAMAQAFSVIYDFNNCATTTGRTDPTPVPVVAGITFGSFMAVAPAGNPNTLSDNPNASGRFSFTGWPGGATNGSDNFTGAINTGQYYEVTLSPQAYYTLALDSIAFTIQRSGTGIRQFAVRSSLDGFAANMNAAILPANAALKVVTGNIFQITDASTTAQIGCKVYFPVSTQVTAPVTIRFYGWNAESAGTFSIDNVNINGSSTVSPTAPIVSASANAISFAATAVNSSSQPISFTVQGQNLTDPIVAAVVAPYALSLTLNGTYAASVSIPVAQSATATPVYVKFSPTATGTFQSMVNISSGAATPRSISITGDGINPDNFVFNFNSCINAGSPGAGFAAYSVTGAQVWACTTFGFNNTNGVNMNGFSSGPQDNEDWLISPPLNLSSISLPVLRFYSRGEFIGPSLQLLVSTNYDGLGDPNTATWTDLNADFPPLNNTWTLTDGIDLSAYKAAPNVYIAFKYVSSPELGAARWTIDEVDITNRTQLFSATPAVLNFGETSAGTNSPPLPIQVKAIGYGGVTLQAPAGYQLSVNNTSFTNQVSLTQGQAEAGTAVFARFSPASKQLKIEGNLTFIGTGLDTLAVLLTATSFPKAETFDIGTYNLSFFGSNPTNNATQDKINTQVANIATVLQKLDLDVVGVQEISNDVALDSLVKRLHNRKVVVSNRWSYSFQGPDPNFPPQKIGFIYDSTTTKLVEARVMFSALYDSARGSYATKLPNYPGSARDFWSGGRLPYLARFSVTIGGVTKSVVVVDIHAKSGADGASYNRRVYDAKVLYDSLSLYYKNDQLVILGDFNDRLFGSTTGSAISPFKPFVDEVQQYSSITLPFDQAGRISYIGGSAMIDHIITSNSLASFNIANSTTIEDPRGYVSGYNGTSASDHLPVYSRFNFDGSLPVSLVNFTATPRGRQVQINWATVTELNSQYFAVERSATLQSFNEIARVKSAGITLGQRLYSTLDARPVAGINYYRLKQVDVDGEFTYSRVVAVNMNRLSGMVVTLYPNPVVNNIMLSGPLASKVYHARVLDAAGRLQVTASGNMADISRQITNRLGGLPSGFYTFELRDENDKTVLRFLKK